jgi:hypothetical protein
MVYSLISSARSATDISTMNFRICRNVSLSEKVLLCRTRWSANNRSSAAVSLLTTMALDSLVAPAVRDVDCPF